MHQIVSEKFIPKVGYWFDVIKNSDNSYVIFNTQRKRNPIDRDGIGYYTSDTFNNLDDAKAFLDKMAREK